MCWINCTFPCTILQQHSDSWTSVPPVAALLLIDLPAVISVHSCNSQPVSIYCISNTVNVCFTAVTVLKTVSIYGISNTGNVCCYSCYYTKDSQYLRY